MLALLALAQPSTSRTGALLTRALNQRKLHATPLPLIAHFDTQLLVERLQQHGLTPDQAQGLSSVLAEAIDETIEQAKFSILQYLVGVATGSGALLMAYMRMMM
ncbi:hypothetical protein CspHIS471_0401590 [Cutaneotrichosporon sp. HIS471]|nr:hypothetical protein CspHIS471_0401590 [Cutaneotrichosporon sp. HIS471]